MSVNKSSLFDPGVTLRGTHLLQRIATCGAQFVVVLFSTIISPGGDDRLVEIS